MKLVNPDFFFQIELPENIIPVLILENPKRFRKLVWELRTQIAGEEGEWVLSDNNVQLKMDKACELILDPFAIDANQRKMLASLYDKIEKTVFSSEVLMEWNQTESRLRSITEVLLSGSNEFVLDYRSDISIKDYLKFMDVRFAVETEDLLEYIIDYMRLSVEVMGRRLFILCNFKNFLTHQDMCYLYEQAMYNKFHLLLLEGHVPEEKDVREYRMIVDKDDCVIMP